MKQLHVTLGSGDEQQVVLQPTSTLTVRTRQFGPNGVAEDIENSWTDITAVSVVEVDDPVVPQAEITQESPWLVAPDTAVAAAASMPIGDAATLLEQAQTKFGDHPDIVAAQAKVAEQLQTAAAPADPNAPDLATGITPPEPQPVDENGDPIPTPDAAADETATPDPSAAASSDGSETSSSTDSTNSDTATGETATSVDNAPAAPPAA